MSFLMLKSVGCFYLPHADSIFPVGILSSLLFPPSRSRLACDLPALRLRGLPPAPFHLSDRLIARAPQQRDSFLGLPNRQSPFRAEPSRVSCPSNVFSLKLTCLSGQGCANPRYCQTDTL